MKFKTFTFPNEPEQCSVLRERRTVVHTLPKGQWQIEELGQKPLVLRGEAVLTESSQYQALESLFQAGGVGLLITPVHAAFYAYLTALERIHEPVENYVRCRFTFVQAPEGDTP